MSENEPSAAALEAAKAMIDRVTDEQEGITTELELQTFTARHFERYAAARVAEAVAAERARVAKTLFARRVIHEDNLHYVPLWVALDIVRGEQSEGQT